MGIKSRLFFFMLLLLVSILGAQEYYLDRSDGDARFVQRLAWKTEEFALRYEVVIQRKTVTKKEDFFEVLREFTDTASIEFSLPSGIYRYRITVYDLLNRPGKTSEWAQFEIIRALKPELYNFYPSFFHLDKGGGPWILNLTGLNFLPDTEIYLRHTVKGLTIVPRDYSIVDPIISQEYSAESAQSNAQLRFDIEQLVPGSYEIYLKNPGGLDTSAGIFEIGYNNTLSIYIGMAYTPLIPIYGNLDQLDNRLIFPQGAALRFGLVPIQKSWGHLGLEFTPTWNSLSASSDSDNVSFNFLGVDINVLFQKWLPNQIMAFTFRAGAGLAETSNMLLPQAQLGTAFLWIFHKPFFMETGIDFIHRFSGSNRSPGYIRPWLGVGINF